MIQLTKVSLAFGDRDILKEVSLQLSKEVKSALSGANGAGKSTLLKIVAGIVSIDSGTVSLSKDFRLGYLPQGGLEAENGLSLWEETEKAYSFYKELEIQAHKIAEQLATEKDPDKQSQLILDHHNLQETILHSGYYEKDQSIGTILNGLGFKSDDYNKEAASFSGGWQMRIALAKVLLEHPDFLLLDEPTNYLDIEAKDWLQSFLSAYEGGFLLVSHDRHFLDQCVNQVIEVFHGGLEIYKGNYSQYQSKREEELKSLMSEYEKQQEELQKLDDFISRFRYNASKAKLVQSRIKQRDKIQLIQIPEGMIPIHFHFPPPPHSGKQVLDLENLNKSYGNHKVLVDVNLNLTRGEKLVITGVNGAGKSTLMRILAGEDTNFQGTVKWGTDVKIGYFSQDHENKLKPSNTILEELESSSPTSMLPQLRNLLGAFLFKGDDVFKQVSVLSGGEKSRLSLLKLLLSPANLLILDEPTNHLDLTSKDVLLEALKEYEGTLLFVSHDRYFIEKLATSVLELSVNGPRLFPGDYQYYRYRLEAEAKGETTRSELVQESKSTLEDLSSGKEEHLRQKELKKERKKWERISEDSQNKISHIELVIQDKEKSLASPEIYSDPIKSREIQDELEKLHKDLEDCLLTWEEAEIKLSE
ncbi:ABC-F family ATP-binding cassette domain-containing protein [Spirochaeta cellobiosiphila]|uniref:ABC-F family ATP-binding cassette domain-containing protein n=1 Tax=Spirochaeta cellobiosiphila TaxID=504483 RepID=UPI00041A6A22|nr:ABC-F family ATP-binding cassette domain-containing protein [Spirochaeta cellobiosiphila]